MIKGAIRKYDFRFESNFIDFLSSLDRASVTYKVDPGTIDHKIDETPDIRFNLQKSADTYASALANRFSKSCNEIEEAVDNIYVKTEKLFLLSRYLIEVESLQHFLSCKESIGYTHKKFTFSNISKEEKYLQVNMDQKDFQEYYFWMDHYLKKMQSFLSQIKHTIELVSQSEFVLPASMVSDPNNSSIERPIAFFEYLFMRNGIAHLRKKFIPTEETNYYYDSIYDSKTETITEHDQDYETGEWRTFTYKFKDTLLKHLIKEFKLSKYYIDEHINLLKNESEIRLFLSLTLTSLKYLLSYIPKDADAKKYDSSPKPIIAIVDYCYSKYAIFCPPKDEVINAVLAGNGSIGIQQGIPETLNRSKPNGIRVFRLKSANIEGFALILHQHLKDGKLISADTDIEIFRKAFDGTSQQEPLKIKWLEKKTKIYPNKQTLFYLLNRLCDAKILEEEGDNNLLFKRINFVFSDFEGKPFKALKVSNNTASTKPPKRITKGKVIVENAIAALKAAGMSSIKP